ncbi:hypothetical protein LTR49_027743 [Elasticomyces elasticus]|nr:hypothetical protein LTR49_027743 [Elasticomyces elasticus]
MGQRRGAFLVLVAVKDSGIGINEEGQRQLFERFRQATPKTSDQYGGSGLGLNISQKLCHLHGGEIGVSSKEGEGSTFGFFFKVKRASDSGEYNGRPEEQSMHNDRLEGLIEAQGHEADKNVDSKDLPDSIDNPPIEATEAAPPDRTSKKDKELNSYKAAEKDKSRLDKDSSESKTGRSSELPTRPGQVSSNAEGRPNTTDEEDKSAKRHVLLVEDNAINQRIVHRKLQSKGFRVITANNGQEAVDAVQKAPRHSKPGDGGFDVILMGNLQDRRACCKD